jgi:hypothetical protein
VTSYAADTKELTGKANTCKFSWIEKLPCHSNWPASITARALVQVQAMMTGSEFLDFFHTRTKRGTRGAGLTRSVRVQWPTRQ